MKDIPSPNALECPPLVFEAAIDDYLKDIDRTLIRENLKLTPAQRAENCNRFCRMMDQIRGLARRVPPSPAA